MKREGQSFILNLMASLALLFLFAADIPAQNGAVSVPEQSIGSITELANKHRALLLVKRAAVVDARGGLDSMIEEALQTDPRLSRRYRLAYNTIARKLNKFMKRHKSIIPVGNIADADYVIFFNLLEYRRPLGVPYAFGELFVIVNPQPGASVGPRVVWKSRKAQWAEDAVDELLDDLRLIR